MLSAGMLREEVEVILDLIGGSKVDEAKQRMELLRPRVATEYGRGTLHALNGILSAVTKSRPAELLDRDRTRRTSERIVNVQMLDEFDRGYFQTLTKWVKRVKPQQQGSRSEHQQ